ncbi:hypothetical protein ACA910_017936 [Epithemia clementina (nom. ined.)]
MVLLLRVTSSMSALTIMIGCLYYLLVGIVAWTNLEEHPSLMLSLADSASSNSNTARRQQTTTTTMTVQHTNFPSRAPPLSHHAHVPLARPSSPSLVDSTTTTSSSSSSSTSGYTETAEIMPSLISHDPASLLVPSIRPSSSPVVRQQQHDTLEAVEQLSSDAPSSWAVESLLSQAGWHLIYTMEMNSGAVSHSCQHYSGQPTTEVSVTQNGSGVRVVNFYSKTAKATSRSVVYF